MKTFLNSKNCVHPLESVYCEEKTKPIVEFPIASLMGWVALNVCKLVQLQPHSAEMDSVGQSDKRKRTDNDNLIHYGPKSGSHRPPVLVSEPR